MHSGRELSSLLKDAAGDVVFIAPYIQSYTLGPIIRRLPESCSLRVITKWAPADLMAGVSDPHIWPWIRERYGSELLLKGDLHGKLYRVGGACLVGSANLTDAGMGWSSNPNAEILWRLEPVPEVLRRLEEEWTAGTVEVTDDLYQWASGLYKEPATDPERADAYDDSAVGLWWPRTRQPSGLWDLYRGEVVTAAAKAFGQRDLEALAIPEGLGERDFNRAVAAALLQSRARAWVDEKLYEPKRFGVMRELLTTELRMGGESRDPTEAWQTMIRWLLHFLPWRYEYRRPRHSEVLSLRSN